MELHYLAMLLGLPSSMVDEEVASFKTEKESKNTNVLYLYLLILTYLFVCTIFSW